MLNNKQPCGLCNKFFYPPVLRGPGSELLNRVLPFETLLVKLTGLSTKPRERNGVFLNEVFCLQLRLGLHKDFIPLETQSDR